MTNKEFEEHLVKAWQSVMSSSIRVSIQLGFTPVETMAILSAAFKRTLQNVSDDIESGKFTQ